MKPQRNTFQTFISKRHSEIVAPGILLTNQISACILQLVQTRPRHSWRILLELRQLDARAHKYARKTLSDILRHIRDVHPHFKGPLRCEADNCPSTLRTYKSLRQHMYEKHKSELKKDNNIDISKSKKMSFQLMI